MLIFSPTRGNKASSPPILRRGSQSYALDAIDMFEKPKKDHAAGGLVAELEEFLGRRVDIVEPDGIRESLRREILQDAVPL